MFGNGFKAIVLIKPVNEYDSNHVTVYGSVKKGKKLIIY